MGSSHLLSILHPLFSVFVSLLSQKEAQAAHDAQEHRRVSALPPVAAAGQPPHQAAAQSAAVCTDPQGAATPRQAQEAEPAAEEPAAPLPQLLLHAGGFDTAHTHHRGRTPPLCPQREVLGF